MAVSGDIRPGAAHQLPPHFWLRYCNAPAPGKEVEEEEEEEEEVVLPRPLRIVDHFCMLRDSNV